jgi:hypothetical protein
MRAKEIAPLPAGLTAGRPKAKVATRHCCSTSSRLHSAYDVGRERPG